MVTQIEAHYHRPDLYEDILQHLKERGVDLNNVTRDDIASVDEFHVRGSEVSQELAVKVDIRNSKILDVGCGLGGPCRMLADLFDCTTTGIDISEEFIRTAKKLSALVGFEKETNFVHGNALALPFDDRSFDIVWTQHVQMNIENKTLFYSEISRVLKDNGRFIYYDIFKGNNLEIAYPVPWANAPELSFLIYPDELESTVDKLGFDKLESTDQTDAGIKFFEKRISGKKEGRLPKLGLNILMGESAKPKLKNVLQGLKSGRIVLRSGIHEKEHDKA